LARGLRSHAQAGAVERMMSRLRPRCCDLIWSPHAYSPTSVSDARSYSPAKWLTSVRTSRPCRAMTFECPAALRLRAMPTMPACGPRESHLCLENTGLRQTPEPCMKYRGTPAFARRPVDIATQIATDSVPPRWCHRAATSFMRGAHAVARTEIWGKIPPPVPATQRSSCGGNGSVQQSHPAV